MSGSKIKVLYVEDHTMVREALARLIDAQADMKVVAAAASGEEAVELFKRHDPDVTLMDLQLPGISGVEAIHRIRRIRDARIIVLTMYRGDEDIYRALSAGAVTYLLKDMVSDDLIRVIRDVHAGKRPTSPAVRVGLEERASKPTLTPRELDVLQLIASGMRDREIAVSLGISEGTVHIHVKNILSKLDARDRRAAFNIALRRGIVHIG